MAKSRQLRLPKFREVRTVKKARKFPQPRVRPFRKIKKFEILYRPFDLRFRGEINKWLTRLSDDTRRGFTQGLSRKEAEIVKLYFYPQKPDDKWFTQEDVLLKVDLGNKKKLRQTLINVMIRVWKEVR